MAQLKFYLDGIEVNPPEQWEDITIDVAWVNESDLSAGYVQPVISASDFIFNGRAAEIILDYINAGLTTGPGIFRGIPFEIQAADLVDGSAVVWSGFLDFLEGYEVIKPYHVRTKLARPEDLTLLMPRLGGLSYGYLNDQGLIKGSDQIKMLYTVQPINRAQDFLWLAIGGYFIVTSIIAAVRDILSIAADIGGVLNAPAGIIKLALQVIYIALLLIALFKLLKELIQRIFPIPRLQNVMSLRRMLEIPLTHLGYTLESNIDELDHIHYVPSRQPLYHKKGRGSGQYVKNGRARDAVPSLQDYGYRCSEMFQLVLDLFNGQLKVQGGKVFLYTESDPFWIRNATYQLPDVLLERYNYNVQDAVGVRLLSFQTDPLDGWTVEDFTGTNYQVNLQSSQTIEQKYRLLKGLKEHRWPVALASRKGILDGLEESFAALSKIASMGSGSNLVSAFKKMGLKNPFSGLQAIFGIGFGLGLMRVERENWNVPKLVYLNGGIPKNHRDKLSARALYNKFQSYRSFGPPTFGGQRQRHPNIEVQFGLKNFLQLSDNAYFPTAQGEQARAISLKWKLGADLARIDFEIIKPYVKTVTETTFEP